MEDSLGHIEAAQDKYMGKYVLILVVMEDSLGQGKL